MSISLIMEAAAPAGNRAAAAARGPRTLTGAQVLRLAQAARRR